MGVRVRRGAVFQQPQPELLLRGERLNLGSRAANRAGEGLLAAASIPLRRQVPSDAPADLACTGSRAPAWLASVRRVKPRMSANTTVNSRLAPPTYRRLVPIAHR